MRQRHVRAPGSSHGITGFSLIEVALVLAILSVAMGLFAQTIAFSARLDPMAVETALAAESVRIEIERMRAVPVEEVLDRYDADPANDPEGPGTAAGDRFDVDGLVPVTGQPSVGRIEMPWSGAQIREELVDEMLGLPRDLNGDGAIDGADHRDDWVVLPIRVRIEWRPRGALGEATRDFEVYTMLARL